MSVEDPLIRRYRPKKSARLSERFSGQKGPIQGGWIRAFFRRVQRRMQVNQVETPGAYVERLRQDPREAGALFRDLLINVTNFFRDAEAFEVLETAVIPKLFANRGADDTVRVWVPGCSSGAPGKKRRYSRRSKGWK